MNSTYYKKHPKWEHLLCGTNGNIWSTKSGRFIEGYICRKGYKIISLTSGKKFKAHRWILETFLGDSQLTVDHIDGDKLNNCLDNLEYVTSNENTKRAHIKGVIGKLGEKSPTCRVSDEDVFKIKNYAPSKKKDKILHAKNLGITIGYYYRILKGKSRNQGFKPPW